MKIRGTLSARTGFTLVEIMIVVAIIGLLAAIAIPNFMKSRVRSTTTACINNLRQIDGAKSQWALELGKASGDTPTDADLFGVDKYVRTKPECPAGGNYELRPVDEPSFCDQPGHVLQ